MVQTWNFSVLRSNFVIAPWYIMPSHKLPSLSERSESEPVGEPFFGSGTGYSVTLPVFGSSLPNDCSPKLEYQAMPSTIDDHVMRLDRSGAADRIR